MPKKTPKRERKVNLENLSQKDLDIISLPAKEVMKKYKLEKQPVYDRKYALTKKIKAAGLTVDQLVNKTDGNPEVIEKAEPKKAPSKRLKREKQVAQAEEDTFETRDLMFVTKPVPVIMKPIEINFNNFSIKLNGVPRKISVNPDTQAIEIDL